MTVESFSAQPVKVDGCLKRALVFETVIEDNKVESAEVEARCDLYRNSDDKLCDFAVLCIRNRLKPKQLIACTEPTGSCISEDTFGYSLDEIAGQQGSNPVE